MNVDNIRGGLLCAAALLCGSLSAQPVVAPLARLAQLGIDPSPASLVQYAAQGDLVTLDMLLAAGIAAGSVEPGRRVTALHTAAAQGHGRIVERLLALGVDVNAQDVRGVTPLVAAVSAGHLHAVRMLLRAGARVDVVPAYAPTALVVAVQAGNPQVVNELIAAGANPALADAFGTAPVDAARRANRLSLLPALESAAVRK